MASSNESYQRRALPRTQHGYNVSSHMIPELARITEDYLFDENERECVREFKIDNDCNPLLNKYKNDTMNCTNYCLKNCNPKQIQPLFDNIPDQIEINTIYGGKVNRTVNKFKLIVNAGDKASFWVINSKGKFKLIYADPYNSPDPNDPDIKKMVTKSSEQVSQELCKFFQYYKNLVILITIRLLVDPLPTDSKKKLTVSKKTLTFYRKGKRLKFVRPVKEWDLDWDRGISVDLEFRLS